jgi:tetratricopeptide (TPR) repeat protein
MSLCGQTAPPSFQTLSRQAEAARDAKQLDKALVLYQRALKLKPDWDEGLWSLGNIAYDLDRYGECAPAFRRLAGLKPDSAPAWTMSGLCEYKLRRYDAALVSSEPRGDAEVRRAGGAGPRRRGCIWPWCSPNPAASSAPSPCSPNSRACTRSRPRSWWPRVSPGCASPGWLAEVPEDSRDLVFQLGDAMAAAMELDYKEATGSSSGAARAVSRRSRTCTSASALS